MTDRELMQQALECLLLWEEEATGHGWSVKDQETVDALRARLACPDAEPAAWVSENIIPFRGSADSHYCTLTPFKCASNTVPLYTTHTIRKWEGLTFEERDHLRNRLLAEDNFYNLSFHISLVEEKLKEKNA